jgi:hypothetical protein
MGTRDERLGPWDFRIPGERRSRYVGFALALMGLALALLAVWMALARHEP